MSTPRPALERSARKLGRRIAKAIPAGTGFLLFVFDFGDEGNLAYLSNADRESMLTAMKEFIARQEGRYHEEEHHAG